MFKVTVGARVNPICHRVRTAHTVPRTAPQSFTGPQIQKNNHLLKNIHTFGNSENRK